MMSKTRAPAACKIAAEFALHMLIMAMAAAIMRAIHPNIPPPVTLMPRRPMPARAKHLATVLGAARAPLAGAGFGCAGVSLGRH